MAWRWERTRVEHAIERGDGVIEGFGVWRMGIKVRFEKERETVPGSKRRRRRKHVEIGM